MKRAALYVRVSTEEQKKSGLSVDSQITALTEYCKSNNIAIQGLYNDAGLSARKSYKKRPALLNMIEACKRGEIDIVLFTKLDRFFRSVADYYACIEQMNGVPWRAIWEDYETETANGVFKVNIMLAVAQSEADRTSERIKSVMEYKRQKQELVSGNLPRGYMIDGKKPVKDPKTEPAINAFFQTYMEGKGLKASMIKASEYGLRLGVSSAAFIINNIDNYSGTIQGIPCEPYVTKEQAKLIKASRKKAPRRSETVYIFSGIIRCKECGCRMGAHKNRSYSPYYNCTARYMRMTCSNSVNIQQASVEKYLLDELDSLLHNFIVSVKTEQQEDNVLKVKNRISVLKRKRSLLIEMYLDGEIEKKEMTKHKDSVDKELNELESYYNKIVPIDTDKLKSALPADWKSAYSELDDEHKKAFWYSILSDIIICNDRSIEVRFRYGVT